MKVFLPAFALNLAIGFSFMNCLPFWTIAKRNDITQNKWTNNTTDNSTDTFILKNINKYHILNAEWRTSPTTAKTTTGEWGTRPTTAKTTIAEWTTRPSTSTEEASFTTEDYITSTGEFGASTEGSLLVSSCDFDDGDVTCDWENEDDGFDGQWIIGDNYDEIRNNTSTYAYMEDYAESVGMCSVTLTQPSCLRFRNYIDNQASAVLVVSTLASSSETVSEVTSTSSLWSSTEITVGSNDLAQQGGFKVCLKAFRTALGAGQVAVDDVSITSGACPSVSEDYECNKSGGLCRWKNLTPDTKWWNVPFSQRANEETEWAFQAPFKAHGLLASPPIKSMVGRCVHFVYHKGNDPKSWLKTLIKSPGREDIVFEDMRKNKVAYRRNVYINVDRPNQFQILFDGRSRYLPDGTHVMNVSVTNELCHNMGLAISMV